VVFISSFSRFLEITFQCGPPPDDGKRLQSMLEYPDPKAHLTITQNQRGCGRLTLLEAECGFAAEIK
jgi:hypothetical protein